VNERPLTPLVLAIVTIGIVVFSTALFKKIHELRIEPCPFIFGGVDAVAEHLARAFVDPFAFTEMKMGESASQWKILDAFVVTEAISDYIFIHCIFFILDPFLVKPDVKPFFCLLEPDDVEIINYLRG
jgi:hypothetical protein